jgi:hypothetical protein
MFYFLEVLMSKGFRNYVLSALACLVVMALAGTELYAQNFQNNAGGTYTTSAPTSGTITMINPAGQFTGGASQLGLNNAQRIAGTVVWNGSAAQTVQNCFYTSLGMKGAAAKNILDACYVSRDYMVALPGGARTYNGIFHYDGTAYSQVIFGENGVTGSAYNNLDLIDGGAGNPKSNNTAVVCNGYLTVQNAPLANLNVGANFTVGVGASSIGGAVSVNSGSFITTSTGTLDINNTAVFSVNGGGSLQLNSTGLFSITSGELTLADVAGNSAFAMNVNSQMDVIDNGAAKGFVNAFLARTNMTFDPSATVRYRGAGAQDVVTTSNVGVNNKYGNLVFSAAGLKTPTADATAPNIYMRGTLNISGGVVQMSATVGAAIADQPILDMDVTGAAADRTTYGSANNDQYVQGKMQLSGTIPTGIAFTMNNAQTKVTFSTSPTTFQFDDFPGLQPTKLNDFLTTDAKRTIGEWFTGTGTISDLHVGYVVGDLAGWAGDETKMRFFEGFDPAQNKQKILIAGHPATRSGAVDPRWVDLTGGTGISLIAAAGGGLTNEISTGSDIILGSASLFITVTSGRWTNPNTWDEGMIPSATDNAEIRHLVYAGIAGPAFNTLALNNTTPEATAYPGNAAACNHLTIRADGSPPLGANQYPSLIVGNEDNGAGYIFHTGTDGSVVIMTLAAGLFMDDPTNPYMAIAGAWDNKATNPGGGNTINGLWVQTIGGVSSNINPPIFGTAQIISKGNVNNNGEIQISK